MNARWLLRLWLVAFWVALWGDVTVANVAAGALLALVVPAVVADAPDAQLPVRPLALVRLAWFFASNLVRSTYDVARQVVRPHIAVKEAILAVPLHDPRDDLVATVVANSISLTPGSLSLEVRDGTDDDGAPRRTLYVHILNAESLEATRRDLLTVQYMVSRALGSEEANAMIVDPRPPRSGVTR